MSDYAIGDVQGCFDALQRLLEVIDFNENRDRLWFVGDLVNRGPQSLNVLRFIKNLPLKPRVCLGNHDLYLLKRIFVKNAADEADDTLKEILNASDKYELGEWLLKQAILHYDEELNVVMTHAGIPPIWSLAKAMKYAKELETYLHSPKACDFLRKMYGNKPTTWSDDLSKMKRLRLICNYFTRMRYCFADGSLDFIYKGPFLDARAPHFPWYQVPNRKEIEADIVFGHWAELCGVCPNPKIYAIDTGFIWGKSLTALCLQDKQRFSVT